MNGDVDTARGWLAKAENDLAAARLLLNENGPYDVACFLCQQTVERYMKGFLCYHNRNFPFTHDLSALAQLVFQTDPNLDLRQPGVAALTRYAVELRYSLDFSPDHQEATDAVNLADQVRADIRALLPADVLA